MPSTFHWRLGTELQVAYKGKCNWEPDQEFLTNQFFFIGIVKSNIKNYMLTITSFLYFTISQWYSDKYYDYPFCSSDEIHSISKYQPLEAILYLCWNFLKPLLVNFIQKCQKCQICIGSENLECKVLSLVSDNRRLWKLCTRVRVQTGRGRGLSWRCSWRSKMSVPSCVQQTTHPSAETTVKRIRTSARSNTTAAGLYSTFNKWALATPYSSQKNDPSIQHWFDMGQIMAIKCHISKKKT